MVHPVATHPWARAPWGGMCESCSMGGGIHEGPIHLCSDAGCHQECEDVGVTTILSIQSSVAYGHVGNSAAVFPLQRLGVEVWPVHTVNFSNHTGYGAWRGPLMPAEDVREVITGIEERGALPEVDAVLSGYQGGEQIGEVILDAVARTKAANPDAIYACDPVMGNATSGCFVHPAIPVLLREKVVPKADLITPNQFELGFLTETDPADLETTLASVERAREMGPSTVLVTSVLYAGFIVWVPYSREFVRAGPKSGNTNLLNVKSRLFRAVASPPSR